MDKEKKTNLKISKKIMVIGIVLFVVGVICLIASISSFVQAKRAYDAAYDQWHDNWWVNHTADLNDQPEPSYAGKFVFIFLSIVLIMASIVVIFVGARPHLTKFANNLKAEIENFNLEETKNLSEVNLETKTTAHHKKECSYCGAKLDKNSNICNYCGKEN